MIDKFDKTLASIACIVVIGLLVTFVSTNVSANVIFSCFLIALLMLSLICTWSACRLISPNLKIETEKLIKGHKKLPNPESETEKVANRIIYFSNKERKREKEQEKMETEKREETIRKLLEKSLVISEIIKKLQQEKASPIILTGKHPGEKIRLEFGYPRTLANIGIVIENMKGFGFGGFFHDFLGNLSEYQIMAIEDWIVKNY